MGFTSGGLIVEEQRLDHGGLAAAGLAHDAEDLALVQVQADVVAGHHRATVWADVGVHVGASALQAEFATPAVDLGQSAYFQNFFHTVVS
ncbi:hypothetical protein CF510_29962 [Pseudomonas aeruginosa PADK2_CF510]|nr:hypothetical protein [Pseudomonas aeruginosa]EIE42682.1 hypothetical protein CF510_29962 [Pseudomonas aeruginosa PADK2_CF510]